MKPPISRAVRATISLLAVVAWLFATNHCVVAGLAPKTPAPASQHQGCPGHKAPAGEKKSGDCNGSSCCKSLSAPLVLTKTLLGYNLAAFVDFELPANEFNASCVEPRGWILELDTGPPGASSFAESVLQRSILAHAPPLSV